MSTIEKALQKKRNKQAQDAEAATQSESATPEVEPKTTLEAAAEISSAKESAPNTEELKAAGSSKQKGKEPPTAESVETTQAPEETPEPESVQEQTIATSGTQGFLKLDLEELEERGFVSVDSTRRLINEEYRAIKRKLLKNAFGPIADSLNNSNIIMVSSARPGEGKTFTAVNLALSIAAEKDKTVLLVDADVLRPNVTKTLRVEPGDGLMEYLLDERHDIADVMYKTNVDKLRIIPAGRSHHLSTELLASQKMQETVDEIASRYPDRIVIIDTPPLIGINETAILTNFAGQAVVVCVEGKSRLSDLDKATSLLNPEMAIGYVVNKAIISADQEQGYYGYYYAR